MKMTAEPGHRAGSSAGWFILGALSGAAIALMLSPASGRENRRVLRRRAREVGDFVIEEGGEFLDAQKRRVQEVVERGQDEAHSFGARVNDAISHGRAAYKAAREAVADVKDAVGDADEEGGARRFTS